MIVETWVRLDPHEHGTLWGAAKRGNDKVFSSREIALCQSYPAHASQETQFYRVFVGFQGDSAARERMDWIREVLYG